MEDAAHRSVSTRNVFPTEISKENKCKESNLIGLTLLWMEITSIDTAEEEEEERNLSLQSTNATEINLNQHLTKTDIN